MKVTQLKNYSLKFLPLFISQNFYFEVLTLISFSPFSNSSPASRPNAAEAGELLLNHHRQADQPVHPVHRQSQRETRAQVL